MKTGEAYWGSREQRGFDFAVASFALPALWVARSALRFSLGSSEYGPLFYQKRVGAGEGEDRIFEIEKLQTLDVTGAPLNTVAGIYRRFGIDELAQLANVRRGEMSMAGPRPVIPKPIEGSPAVSYEEIMDNLASSPDLQKRWHYVTTQRKPGVISTHGLYQHTIPDCDQFVARAEMDIQDGMDASPVSDFRLLGQYVALATQRRL